MAEQDQGKPMTLRRLGVREFRGNMADFLRQAQGGRSFLVPSRDEVLAEIHPPSKSVLPPRRPGMLRGKIRMAEDFDSLPPDLLAAMESGTV